MNRRDLLKGALVVAGSSTFPAASGANIPQPLPPPLFRNLPGDPLRAMNELHSRVVGEVMSRSAVAQDELIDMVRGLLHSFDDLFRNQFGFPPMSHNVVTGPTGKLGIRTYFSDTSDDFVWESSTRWEPDGEKILTGGCHKKGFTDHLNFYRLTFDTPGGQNDEPPRSSEGRRRRGDRGVSPLGHLCRTDQPSGAPGGAAERMERTLRPRGRAVPVRCEDPRVADADASATGRGPTGVRSTLRVQGASRGVQSSGEHERSPEPAEHYPLQITLV